MVSSDLRKDRQAKVDQYRKERFGSVMSSAESALKSAFLVNGGGAVALLAFFGQSQSPARAAPATALLALALLALILGTALAGVATGLSFLAQYGYFMRRSRSWFGKAARSLTAANIALIVLSHACFVFAGFTAYRALA